MSTNQHSFLHTRGGRRVLMVFLNESTLVPIITYGVYPLCQQVNAHTLRDVWGYRDRRWGISLDGASQQINGGPHNTTTAVYFGLNVYMGLEAKC